jgi:putative salt-induced outer membrane protein
MRLTLCGALLGLLMIGSVTASAEELCPCPPPAPPPPLWAGSVGLSYLATSGNTDSQNLGFTMDWSRRPTPWGLDVKALVNQNETEGVTTAEKLLAGFRGKRAFGERFEGFGGLTYEQDEFAGFDSRTLVEAGGLWRALVGPVHALAFDAGLTWTTEDPVVGASYDYLGAVAGLDYAWKISAAATFRERLVFFPNFDQSDDWRFRSDTVLEAALASSWAMRVGFLYTRDNLPAPGFEKDDTSTSVSLVWKR